MLPTIVRLHMLIVTVDLIFVVYCPVVHADQVPLQNCQTNPASAQHLLGLHCYDKWNALDACGNTVGIGQCFLVRLDLWQTKGEL